MNCITQHIVRIANNCVSFDGDCLFSANRDDDFRTFAKSCYTSLNIEYPKFYKMDKLCKIGFLAFEFLTNKIDFSQYADDEIGILLSNSSSSLNDDCAYQPTIADVPSPAVFVYTLANIVIGEICIRHKMYGESTFFVSETDNREFLKQYATTIATENSARAFVVGRVEIDANDNYFAELEFLTIE